MIDLHSHSIFSDGTDEPEAMVLMGESLGLKALALTDHDTLEGLPRFLAMQPQVRMQLVPGVELSCRFMNMELHILGLFVDPADARLQTRIRELRRRREDRNDRMAERLQGLGYPITLAEVSSHAPTTLVSRIHFAKALVSRGIAGSRQDAFARLIGDGCPGHVPFEELLPGEAARWIKEAGGVPLVAHPGRSATRNFRWDEAMRELQRQGLEGFEAYYGEYGPNEQRYFCALAQELGMVPCGGSDYHGANKPGLRLGRGRGGLQVPDELLEQLEDRQQQGAH